VLVIAGIVSCKGQNDVFKKHAGLTYKFSIDDSLYKEDVNDFKLIHNADTVSIQIKGDSLFLPEIDTSYIFDLSFFVGPNRLYFKKIKGSDIWPYQTTIWNVGIDHNPFDLLDGFLSRDEIEMNIYKKIEFLQFLPREHGDGLQFINKY
jgi:hypothetical protein